MKKIFCAVAALVITASSFAQKTAAEVAKFSSETIDLGKVKQNVPATATFTVTNIGNEPLIIEQANPTCGCTVGDYTKSPIMPGKSGTITATFNAAALNHFDKHLNVKFAGVSEFKSITLSGDVLSAEDFDKWKLENDAKVKADAKAMPVSSTNTVSPAKSSKTKSKMKTSAVKTKG